MTAHRRDKMMGASYFFTINLLDRQSDLLTRHIDDLRFAYRQMIEKYPIRVDAMVVLPDHIHAIWTPPVDDDNDSIRWQALKILFSKSIPNDQQSHRSASRIQKRELGVWQRRFWEHHIRDENDFRRHMDYIHYNPVKHEHVTKLQDWEYSTFHRCVKLGIYESNWSEG